MGELCHQAHLHISVETEVYLRRERGTEQRDRGGGWQVLPVQTSTVHSNKASDGPCASYRVSRPAFMSPGFYIWGQQISQSWDAWRLEFYLFIFWNYFLGFLYKHAVYPQATYYSVSTYGNSVKRLVGWVRVPHHNCPLLQYHTASWLWRTYNLIPQ